jgi:hypothetical protein
MTITKRSTKGSALTYAEMDENLRDLDEDMTIDRVLGNGNTTTKDITVNKINYTEKSYTAGEVVQQYYYRYDGIQSFTTAASGLNSTDHSEFGRLVHVTPFDTVITPKFSDSLIVWELQIHGEPTNHNSGWLIGEDVSGTATVIRRTGYEGYNNTRPRDQQNTFISDHYDGDNNSTLRLTRIMYFDKPEITETKTYQMIFTSTTDNANYTYRINRTANTSSGTSVQQSVYEVGVSTWCIKEIAQ